MGKKTKSKQRLDKYYHLAKDQGYRSRAAYKLIQLNKKYHFLENSMVIVDLCAAPGGWMQVASKNAASSCLIIGVDLDPIKLIPGCISIQEDITSKKCLDEIRQYTKHLKANVVLNDGAPNVGANWNKDSYSQNELVLLSLKLVTQLLKKGGVYVTKVFRSQDYQNLIWVLGKFFGKVEANKPQASRDVSAEIFLVCQNYLDPEKIDKRFFDPNFVFNENEKDIQDQKDQQNIQSISKLFQKKKKELIDDKGPSTMYWKSSLIDFINSENPYVFIQQHNALDCSDKELIDHLKSIIKLPQDFEELYKDLRVLGKSEIGKLIKIRARYLEKQKVELKSQKTRQEAEQITDQQEDDSIMELEEDQSMEIEDNNDATNKREEKNKEKMLMKYVKNKMLKEQEEIPIDDMEDFPIYNFDEEYRDVELEQEEQQSENSIDTEEQKMIDKKNNIANKKKHLEDLNNNIEYLYEQKKIGLHKTQQEQDKKEIQQNKQEKQSKLENLFGNTKKTKEDRFKNTEFNMEKLKEQSKWFSQGVFDVLKNKEETKEVPKIESESEEEEQLNKEEKAHKVLQENYKKSSNKKIGDFDDEEIAEILAIGKKMLRKKDWRDIVDQAYNRYNYDDNPEDLPDWFVEDERKHIGKFLPVSKDDVQREKEALKVIRNWLPKKVMEAKMRKKKRIFKSLEKAQTQVTCLMEKEGNDSISRARQINDLYRKAAKAGKDKRKEVIVSRKSNTVAPNKKQGRRFKVVDKRLKKDTRALKWHSKIEKKGNKGNKQSKSNKSNVRHKRRH